MIHTLNHLEVLIDSVLIYCISDDNDEHQDTLEQILKCIIENEGEFNLFFFNIRKLNICASCNVPLFAYCS